MKTTTEERDNMSYRVTIVRISDSCFNDRPPSDYERSKIFFIREKRFFYTEVSGSGCRDEDVLESALAFLGDERTSIAIGESIKFERGKSFKSNQ
jgi:hypothetical protein